MLSVTNPPLWRKSAAINPYICNTTVWYRWEFGFYVTKELTMKYYYLLLAVMSQSKTAQWSTFSQMNKTQRKGYIFIHLQGETFPPNVVEIWSHVSGKLAIIPLKRRINAKILKDEGRTFKAKVTALMKLGVQKHHKCNLFLNLIVFGLKFS